MVEKMMVRYKVNAGEEAANEALVQNVFANLHETAPAGLRYATFVLEDGVSFMHIVAKDREDGRDPLVELPAFQAFLTGLSERCEQPPARTAIREVGSYGLWDE